MNNLIEMFNLQDEVTKFVKARVKELAQGNHTFGMSGHPRQCENDQPHPPHADGGYSTVANGWGAYMCDGVQGQTPEGQLVIVFERRSSGSPYKFAVRSGYWFVKAEETQKLAAQA